MLDNFDFSLLDNEDFKEDSVRELLIKPLLDELGFEGKKAQENLSVKRSVSVRSETITGSNKRIKANEMIIPDYLLYVGSKPHCVLDAKAPTEKIAPQTNNERQAFYYAINKEIKTPYYALCNGYNFNLFQTSTQELLLEIDLKNDLNSKFTELKQYLTTPIQSLKQNPNANTKKPKKSDEWYLSREIPKPILNPTKQGAKRHFGSMAYFTKQSWDIVAQNIKAFTAEGDIVLDSFGGSGVTAIEAMMNNRLGIHTDLNPLSIFMVKALTAKVNLGDLWELSEEILNEFENLRPKNEKEAKALLKNAKYYPNAIDKEFGETATAKMQDEILWIPQDEILPKGSDVPSVRELFSPLQLAELALLRKLILRKTIKQKEMRYSLLLAFRNVVTMCNLTYHDTEARKGKGGNTSVYLAYRYRIPKKPTFLNIAEVFSGKIKRALQSKQELENSPHFYNAYFQPLERVIKDFKGAMITQRENIEKIDSLESKTNGEKIFQADATNLKEIESESVDFIYTDPPYGAKIPYLDLSIMWNVWLDLPVDLDTREKECIEKGSLQKTRHDYYDLMKASLQEMFRVLKYNRWLVFVFQHEDSKLFQTIIDSAENCGFEYTSCVNQSNGQSSFKNRQMPAFVFKGQFNLYFKKVDNPKTRTKVGVGFDILGQMFKDIEEIIVENDGATLNEMWQHLVPKASINGYFHLIQGKFQTFVPDIERRFEKRDSEKYHLKPNSSFTNDDIMLEKRTRYLIESILKQAEIEGKNGVEFSQIVSNVVPLSRNGVQANNKLVKEILSEIAIPNKSTGEWRLKPKEATLFDDL